MDAGMRVVGHASPLELVLHCCIAAATRGHEYIHPYRLRCASRQRPGAACEHTIAPPRHMGRHASLARPHLADLALNPTITAQRRQKTTLCCSIHTKHHIWLAARHKCVQGSDRELRGRFALLLQGAFRVPCRRGGTRTHASQMCTLGRFTPCLCCES